MRIRSMMLVVVMMTAWFWFSDVATCSAIDYPSLDHEIFLYDGVTPIRLTNDLLTDSMPRMNNSGQVVWQKDDGEDWEIFFYDGSTIVQITDNDYDDQNPRINDNGELVWEGDAPLGWEIFFYDGATTLQITDNDYDDRDPEMNGLGQVVWEAEDGNSDEADILLFDGTTTTRISDDIYRDRDPDINDSGYVVWSKQQSGWDIHLYDGANTTDLSTALGVGTYVYPKIANNGHVVWEELDDDVVYLYDGTQVVALTQEGHVGDSPGIADNGNVVWRNYEHGGAGTEIHLYDGTTTLVLGDATQYVDPPGISGNGTHVVWEDSDGINLYDGSTTIQVVAGQLQMQSEPGVNNSGHVVWMERVCMDNDGDGYGNPGQNYHCTYMETDCDDGNPEVNPGAAEGPLGDPTCTDALDNDCDGLTDVEEPTCDPCVDADGDGYGASGFLNCTYPEEDCDDGNPEVNPGATEIQGNGLDDDCNPETPDVVLFHPRVDLELMGLGAVAGGDLNGDHFDDLVVGEYGGETPASLKVFMSKGNGSFKAPVTVWADDGGLPTFAFHEVIIRDLNNDDNPDIVAAGGAVWYGATIVGMVVALMGNGDGTFEEGVILSPPGLVYYQAAGIVAKDLNHDDNLDLCVSFSGIGSYIQVFPGNGDGTFDEGESYAMAYDSYDSVKAPDLNGDTHPDLALTNSTGDSVLVLLGLGDGTFQDPVSYAVGNNPASMADVDLNGDDHPDLVVVDKEDDGISVLLGVGDGTLGEAEGYAVGEIPYSVVAADFDEDDRPDIATANASSDDVSILMGNGDGTFGNEGRYATASGPRSLATGDFNGDGHTDLCAAGGDLSIFLNILGAPPATAWGAAATLHPDSEAPSKVLNTCLLILLPAVILLLRRGRTAISCHDRRG